MKFTPFIVAFSFALAASAQNNQRDWSSEMQNPQSNFVELTTTFQQDWNGVEITPGCGWKPFKRWEWLMSKRLDANGQLPQSQDIVRAWRDYNDYAGIRSPQGDWQQLGPIIDGITTRDDIPGVGRMNFIAFHPQDENILFAGAPAGGLWRSYDAGNSWICNTDNFPTLGVSAIAFDPINSGVVYIGTGDRDAGDAPGMGVMKSTDGGETWEFSNAGIENKTVNDIIVDPVNSDIILIGTNAGLFRSTDAGASWTEVSTNTVAYKDLDMKPGDSQTMYATGQGRFYRSADNGVNWEFINEGIQPGTRYVIATTPANPELVYVLSTSTYEFRAFFRSLDSGQNFEEMSDQPNIMGWAANGDGDGGQAWYDLCIAADYDNPDVVYVGGVRMKKSTDAGVTWQDINNDYLHVDHHHCAISPHNHDLYLANDGGLYHYENNEVWNDISNGVVTGQIYKLGQSMHTSYKVLSGFQDNGTMEYRGAQWFDVGGGDGFECFYDPTDEDWRYGSIYYGNIYRTSNDFTNQRICGYDELGIDEDGGWVTPFQLASHDENTMFVGLKNVWRSRNIKHPDKDEIVWERISWNLGSNNNSNMTCVEHSAADTNLLYGSEGSRKFFRCSNILAPLEEVVWEDLSNSLPWFSVPVNDIETHPTDSSIVWIAFNNNIYQSDDRGENWTDISANLPDININSIVYDLYSDGGLYLGCDIGIYYKDSSMDEWLPFNSGFPVSARVTELDIYYGNGISDSRIRAATYGRGVWESDLYDSETHHFPSVANLSIPGGNNESFEDFEVQLVFYKNLGGVPVNGLEIGDIQIDNGIINAISGGPLSYTLSISPLNFGEIQVYVPDSVVTDEFTLYNFDSDTLSLIYSPVPEPFGWEGPGGVGFFNEMSLWMRSDREVYDELLGETLQTDSVATEWWADISGNSVGATLQNEGTAPVYRIGEDGISGLPAIQFDGISQYFEADDVPVSRDMAVFSVMQADSTAFNEHGWFASSREDNGFILHPWHNSQNFSAIIYDNDDDEHMGGNMYAGEFGKPHVYGMVYYDNGVNQQIASLVDAESEWRTRNVNRDDSDNIDIRYGRDFDDRWGRGLMAETFMYRKRMFESQRTIVHNYLGARYQIDQGGLDKFHLDSIYRYELAGIGKVSEIDFHADAKGLSKIRISEPSDLDNNEYLMIAENGQPVFWVDELYPVLSPRILTQWGFEATGAPGQIRVRFYDETNALDNISQPGLIVGNAVEFEAGMEYDFFPLSESEEGIWEANVVFNGTGSFTIGTAPTVAVSEVLDENDFIIYPNPSVESCVIRFPDSKSKFIRVIDSRGVICLELRCNGPEQTITTANLPSGVYQISVLSGNKIQTKKLVVR
jgi:photosystem II stability/assembly factor-like uncharacterized protein